MSSSPTTLVNIGRIAPGKYLGDPPTKDDVEVLSAGVEGWWWAGWLGSLVSLLSGARESARKVSASKATSFREVPKPLSELQSDVW
jgi:hypothetical protein